MTKKKQIIEVLRGLPASGKSTYAKDKCEKDTNWMRINRDDIRHMLGKYGNFNKTRENIVSVIEENSARAALMEKKNVIIDATNLNPKYGQWVKDLARDFDTELVYIDFNTLVGECIKRDLKRENSVGEKIIRRMWKQYIVEMKPVEQNHDLPEAVIFDIDGTLAHMTERGPYDYKKVHTDEMDREVANLFQCYKGRGVHVIIMTGRDGGCQKETNKWLKDKGLEPDSFYQRAEGDTRDDSLIKYELFDENIRDKWDVLAVFDDRDRVVDMWRELGLKCFQCENGAF